MGCTYHRSIIFTEAPLLKAFRYRDRFQLVPIYYSHDAPISSYARHIPCFLEYEFEDKEEPLQSEDFLRKRGISEEIIRLGRKIPNQTRARKEILHLLSALTNFHFFEYNIGKDSWGFQMPMKGVDELKQDEEDRFNNQTSHWAIRDYIYPAIAEDLKITKLTDCNEYYHTLGEPISYFTTYPEFESNQEIKLPPYLDFVLDKYYSLKEDERNVVRQCLGLLYEGIGLFNTSRSVSLLSIVSSIEGMAKLDFEKYGSGKMPDATRRFLQYLKTYVAGKSEDKFRSYYKKRCEITHEGALFLSDLDLYGDSQQQDVKA